MHEITTLGLDIAKNVFQLHGVERIAYRRIATLPPLSALNTTTKRPSLRSTSNEYCSPSQSVGVTDLYPALLSGPLLEHM